MAGRPVRPSSSGLVAALADPRQPVQAESNSTAKTRFELARAANESAIGKCARPRTVRESRLSALKRFYPPSTSPSAMVRAASWAALLSQNQGNRTHAQQAADDLFRLHAEEGRQEPDHLCFLALEPEVDLQGTGGRPPASSAAAPLRLHRPPPRP